jgi:hypothetical protein
VFSKFTTHAWGTNGADRKGTGAGTALPFPRWRLRAAYYLNYDPRNNKLGNDYVDFRSLIVARVTRSHIFAGLWPLGHTSFGALVMEGPFACCGRVHPTYGVIACRARATMSLGVA